MSVGGGPTFSGSGSPYATTTDASGNAQSLAIDGDCPTEAFTVTATPTNYPAAAQTFNLEFRNQQTVTDGGDAGGGNTLRDKINASCPSPASPTVPRVIFDAAVTNVTLANSITLSEDIEIDGPGVTILGGVPAADYPACGGSGTFNHIFIVDDITATLNSLTLTLSEVEAIVVNGLATLNFQSGTVSQTCNASAIGNAGTATISSSTISGTRGTAFYEGGAINANGVNTTITGSTISDNEADNGGGIFVNAGNVTITGSNFTTNRAVSGNGGAIFGGTPSTFAISASNFTTNQSLLGNGGAIYQNSGTLTITGGIFNGNQAPSAGTPGGALAVFALGGNTVMNLSGAQFASNTVGFTGVGAGGIAIVDAISVDTATLNITGGVTIGAGNTSEECSISGGSASIVATT
ncbi:MAG: right-handed parallel beta-helix repeat-containing protein, partial [Chloroflexota bacterium]